MTEKINEGELNERLDATKIVNAKDEPEFGMKVSTPNLFFKFTSQTAGYVTITLTNTKPEKQAFKFKATSNQLFCTQPSIGFIMPNEKVYIKVTYLNPGRKLDFPPETNHVAVYHTNAGDHKTVKEAFSANKVQGVYHFFCNYSCEYVPDPNKPDGDNK